jgi:hypothetical protein
MSGGIKETEDKLRRFEDDSIAPSVLICSLLQPPSSLLRWRFRPRYGDHLDGDSASRAELS